MALKTNHVDNVGEKIAAADVNAIAVAVNALVSTVVQAPAPSGADDTVALQAVLTASAGATSTLIQLQAGPYVISSTLKIFGNTRMWGTMGTPNAAGQGVTTIQPANGAFTGTELICNNQIANTFDLAAAPNANPWGPGISIGFLQLMGLRPDGTKPANLSGIRFCGGENSLFDTIGCDRFTAAGIHMVYGSAPMVMRNITSHLNAWGIWFDDSGGPVFIESISGDSNDNLIYIANTVQDPNLGGGHFLQLTIGQIKAECNPGLGGTTIIHKHAPLIKAVNLDQGGVTIIGGRISDYSAATGTVTTLSTAILIGDVMAGAATVTVGSTVGYAVPTQGGPAYFDIDAERFSYTGVGSGVTFTGVTRAVDGTVAAAHAAAASVTQSKPAKSIIDLSATGAVVNNEPRQATGNINLIGVDAEVYTWMLRDSITGAKLDIAGTNAYPEWQRYGVVNYRSRNLFWSPQTAAAVTGGLGVTRGLEVLGVNPTISFLDGADASTAPVTQILFGNGVPATALGTNGSIYFRRDGGAGTTMYQKRAGLWVATAS